MAVLGLLSACSLVPEEAPQDDDGIMGSTSGMAGPADATGEGPGGEGGSDSGDADESPEDDDVPDDGAVGDLPCEIDAILSASCRSCHSDPPNGAPFSLVSLADLSAPALSDPSRSVAEVALERMQSADNPMPPAPGTPVDAASIDVFEQWVGDGLPASSDDCEGEDEGPSPFGGPAVCTSGDFNRYDDDEDEDDDDASDDGSPRMAPGRACIDCHDRERDDDDDVPDLIFAGTVYPTGHEPDECVGADAEGAEVHVQSADGEVVVVTVNAAGNFLLHRRDAPDGFGPPYRVKVVTSEGERVMPVEAPKGDCNDCHTQFGDNGAPGRIVLP